MLLVPINDQMKVPLLIVLLLAALIKPNLIYSQSYVIYNINQSIPMGFPQEVIKKNYYINMGTDQGVSQGSLLDIYRTIYRIDPYNDHTQKNRHYQIKIGELEVIHTENKVSIARLTNLKKNPFLLEIESPIIGDQVKAQVR